ncbi:MAG: hypothetical protein ABIV63_12090, partial [Caldimonas sp.]
MRHASSGRRTQRGTSLLEALIAFITLSMGMLAVGHVQTHLRLSSDVARQRSEAVRLGQEDLESVRAFSVVAASAGLRSFDAIASAATTIDAASGYATNARFLLTREVDVATATGLKQVRVQVDWDDRSGGRQHVELSTAVARQDPAYSAALVLSKTSATRRGALGRSAFIPLEARDLGDGRSAFKPVVGAAFAWLFDAVTGRVTGRCSGLAPESSNADLTIASLTSCDTNVGYLVSG